MQECTVCQCANAQSAQRHGVHSPRVTTDLDPARAFLAHAVEASGLSPYALSKKAGVAPTTITRPLNDPAFKFTPKLATLQKIAEAAGIDLPAGVVTTAGPPSSVTELPLIGPVQAGAWLALDDTVQDEPRMLTAAVDPRYPHAPQWLREVRGDSMNARGIEPGHFVHIADFGATGINLNTGMIVEVTRTRDDGSLREVTLKEVEITPQGVKLWPRSTNPRWKDPVILDDGQGSDVVVQVTGLLLMAMRRYG